MDPPSSPLSKKTIHNSRNLRHFPSTSVVYSHGIHALFLAYTHTRTHPSHPHMSTADQPSIGDTGEHNGECQGKGESDQSRKRKDRGEDDPMEAGAAPGAHTDTHDLGIANPPTPAPTEANAGVHDTKR